MAGLRAPNRRRHRHLGRWLIIVGAAVFCVAVLLLLVRSQPVEVTQSHLEEAGGQVYVAGQVRNRGDKASSIKLELHYYDQAGHALGLDTVSLDALAAGSVRSFRGPAHDAGTIADYSIYLNQGRNPYGN
jgi:hypothetical protein